MNRWLLLLSAACVGGLAFTSYGYFARSNVPTSPVCTGQYSLIDPRFNCDEYSDSFAALSALQSTLGNKADKFILNKDATRISIWIRDLTTLQWVGVHEKEQYAPASLFKVPIMIAVYKYAEIQPSILGQKILYTAAAAGNVSDVLTDGTRLKEGTEYSVEQLVEQMIRYSDNEAFALLTQRLSTPFLAEVYSDLGIHLNENQTGLDDLVTARSYANIFRILYQSSYLTPEYSQKALSILASTGYTGGARAAIPDTVKIAHKFGVRREMDLQHNLESIKLHDCGIAYASQPYLFCILTEGTDETKLNTVISSLSSDIYGVFK